MTIIGARSPGLPSGMAKPPLVSAEGLVRSFASRGGLFARSRNVSALRGVDVSIASGEAVGVVGESGCGKSTLARVLLHLLPPTSGHVRFDGTDLSTLSRSRLRVLRRRMQMIFQDPFASLDPRRSIGAQIGDGLRIHGLAGPDAAGQEIAALLQKVGLDPSHAARRPHEFSGGQRQRIAIARALATKPDFLVADEPVSALDVSIQAQVVNLLADLRAELGLALLFISHDLHVVRHLCDRVMVMYLGRVVEEGPTAEVFGAPAHPYTRTLIAATPTMRRGSVVRRQSIPGEMPSPMAPPSGCAFRTRCALATPACAAAVPALAAFGEHRRVACIHAAA